MKNESQTVPKEIYDAVVKQINERDAELELHRQRSPLVGIRWYGQGTIGIGLSHPVSGMSKLILENVNDKAVIDYTTWLRVRKIEHSRIGLLVRDDAVIEELEMQGAVAKPDTEPVGPNSFTEKEAENILTGSMKDFKRVVMGLTSHWAAFRLLWAAEHIGMNDIAKIALLKARQSYLLIKFNLGLLHPRDLDLACEVHHVAGWIDMTREQKIDSLTEQQTKAE